MLGESRTLSVDAIEEVLALRPDIIFLPDEPYEFSVADAAEIRGPRVIGPFPGHLFTWHGTRTILGLRFLRDRKRHPSMMPVAQMRSVSSTESSWRVKKWSAPVMIIVSALRICWPRVLELLHVAVLVLRAVQDQHRLLAGAEIAEVVFVDRRADQKERVDGGDLARGARGHPRAEREAADDHLLAGMLLHQPVDRGHDVALLAFAFLVMPGAGAGAAEVEAERGHVRGLESARGAEDDFVVQRAAAEGMRMADHGDGGGILQIAVERLELAGARKEIDVAERFRVHSTPDVSRTGASLTRMRSPSTFTSCVAIVYSALPGQRPVRTSNPHRCHGQTISSPIEIPLGERTAAMRAGVVGGEESARGVGDGDAAVVDLHGPDAADWKFGRVQDLGKGFVHRRRTVAKAMSVNLFAHGAVRFPVRLFRGGIERDRKRMAGDEAIELFRERLRIGDVPEPGALAVAGDDHHQIAEAVALDRIEGRFELRDLRDHLLRQASLWRRARTSNASRSRSDTSPAARRRGTSLRTFSSSR